MEQTMRPSTSDIQKYTDLPYSVEIEQDECEGGTRYLAIHPELSGCMAQGDTTDEAISNLAEARNLYIGSLLRRGIAVPMPEAYSTKRLNANTISTSLPAMVSTFQLVTMSWINSPASANCNPPTLVVA